MGDIKAMGTISTSNVNNPNSQCITLTYTISNVKNMKAVAVLTGELDEIHSETSQVDIEVKDYGGDGEAYKMKYKVKTCENEATAHIVKHKLDSFLKKKGGQTTLDVTPAETETE